MLTPHCSTPSTRPPQRALPPHTHPSYTKPNPSRHTVGCRAMGVVPLATYRPPTDQRTHMDTTRRARCRLHMRCDRAQHHVRQGHRARHGPSAAGGSWRAPSSYCTAPQSTTAPSRCHVHVPNLWVLPASERICSERRRNRSTLPDPNLPSSPYPRDRIALARRCIIDAF